MKTAVVIPAYNEATTIKEVVEGALRYVDRVIVVDDGSTDSTARRAMETEAEVIVNPENMGKAHALKTGFKEAKGYDVVVMMDADHQHRPEDIPHLLSALDDGIDLCIGSRFLGCSDSMPLGNRLSNMTARYMMAAMLGQKITDPQSGFRAIKREALEMLELPADRYAIEHIMVLEAVRKRFKIKEVPITCVYGEEKSHISPIRDTVNVMKNILKFMLRSENERTL
jgi:glycosyltransferase involved in cell wall biosynthesis